MKFKAGLIGFPKLEKKLGEVGRMFDKAASDSVVEATLLVHETAVKSLQDNTDGPRQTRYGPKREVNVSNPGDPPNTDTGRAVQSIQFDVKFQDKRFTGFVGTGLKYLAWLEFGTEHTAARPWLGPALQKCAKKVGEIFEKKLSNEITKVKNK